MDSQKEFQDTQFLLGSAPQSKAELLWDWTIHQGNPVFSIKTTTGKQEKLNNKFPPCHSDCRSSPAFHEIRGFTRGTPAGIPGLPPSLDFQLTQFPASQEPARQQHFHCSVHRSAPGKPPARKFPFSHTHSPSRKALKTSQSPQRTPIKRNSGGFQTRSPKQAFKQMDLENLA